MSNIILILALELCATWGSGTIIQKGSGSTLLYALKEVQDGPTNELEFDVGTFGTLTIGAPSAGSWHSAVASWDGYDMRLYVDGTLDGTYSPTDDPSNPAYGGSIPIVASTEPLTIGAATDGSNSFDGTIAEAKVYNYVASPSDVFAGPSVTTAATPSDATPTTINLTAAGIEGSDDSNLTYTWVPITVPTGAADPFFDDNGDNSASSTKATFFAAGLYDFEVLISDGVLTTSSVLTGVSIDQTLTSIDVVPGDGTTIAPLASHWLSGIGLDQFNNQMVTQPTITLTPALGSISSGTYVAPDVSVATDDIVTASVDGSTATGATTFHVVPDSAASATEVPDYVTSVSAIVEDGTDVQVNWTTSSTADGYLIEASTDGGSTYNPIGTAQGADTMFLATNLIANASYLFRVTPFNAAGEGSSTTSSAATVGEVSDEAWYKVSFNDTGSPSYETLASDSYGGSGGIGGQITLSDSDWVQADSEANAVLKALSGYRYVYSAGAELMLGQSSAFQYVQDYQVGGTDIGPALVVRVGSGVRYVPLTIMRDRVVVTASYDQTTYSVPSGALSLGTFLSSDPAATASDFTASVSWHDGTDGSSDGPTPALTIVSLGAGEFGVYASAGAPSDSDAQSYTINVARSAQSVSAADFVGYGGSVGMLVSPDSLRQGQTRREISVTSGTRQVAGVFLQKISTMSNKTGTYEDFLTWKARGVNTLIWAADDNNVFPTLGEHFETVSNPYPPYEPIYTSVITKPAELGNPTNVTNYNNNYDYYYEVIQLARWIQRARLDGMYYILPIQNVVAISNAEKGTSALASHVRGLVGTSDEWSDPRLTAVSIQADEPNGGVDLLHPPGETMQEMAADIQAIHQHSKLAYVNLAGP